MNITLITHTPDPLRIVAAAARLCYSDAKIDELLNPPSRKNQASLVKKVIGMGHYSVLEHVSFTFGIEGISRACSHQLVRHRIASYSQQSQRYVEANTDNFGYNSNYQDQCVFPESILNASEVVKARYYHALKVAHQEYAGLLALGVPAEDARFVLPNAQCTALILTMNARSLRHFFNLRCCNRAQNEIREVAKLMLGLSREASPELFNQAGPKCLIGKCPEGKLSCGKIEEVRKEYQ